MLEVFLLLLSGSTATTYGWGEDNCNGPCVRGNLTASGEHFSPAYRTAAIALPTKFRLRARDVWLRTEDGPCTRIRINDRRSGLSQGKLGWDLTPAAVKALGGKATPNWSGRVYLCAKS
jgi:hypothetical protein